MNRFVVLWVMAIAVAFSQAQAATRVASYLFHDTLAAEEPGMPALVSVDPTSANHFHDDSVFGQSRRVFYFGGNVAPLEQGGLSLTFPPAAPTNEYSVEMIFQFHARERAWRRILDVQDRHSDQGFYVDPGNTLDVYPVAGSSSNFVSNVYHHVVLTIAPDGGIRSYLDGTPQFTIANNPQMIVANPARLLHLFLDNIDGGGQGEYSPGDIALFRLYAGVLTPDEVAALAGIQGPPLRIEKRGTDVVVSWSAGAADYHLESNPAMKQGDGWNAVSQSPVPAGDRLEVVQSPAEPGRFYRLAKP